MTEAQAVRAALDSHPSVEAARAAIEAAKGLEAEADFLLPDNPSLRLERTTDRWHHNNGEREWVAEISAPVWIAGQRGHRQALAAAKRHEAEEDVETVRWALVGAVRAAYWQAWQVSELLKAAIQRRERSEALREAAERQVRAKEMREFDARNVAAEALADRRVEAARRGELEAAVAVLTELTGVPGSELKEFETPTPAAPQPQSAATVDEARPDLRALRRKLEGASANLGLQEANAWPTPELALAAKRTSADYDKTYDDSVIFGVKVPIPVVQRNQREIMAAGADLNRTRADYQLALNRARRELTQADSGWRAAWRQWQDASEALRLSNANLDLIETGFKVGEISSIDLIQEKRRWGEALEAERTAVAALALARTAWEQAAGAAMAPTRN